MTLSDAIHEEILSFERECAQAVDEYYAAQRGQWASTTRYQLALARVRELTARNGGPIVTFYNED